MQQKIDTLHFHCTKFRLNLATFVTTHMEKESEDLMLQGCRKNAIDMDEYPQVKKMEQRCVNMLCRLYNAPLGPDEQGTGTACVGSSEAIMLATLAMKWKWKERCSKVGGRPSGTPNIVFGANVQCCWHKACKYFEVEAREATLSDDCIVLTAERARPLIDENTIGVCPILGSTFNGEYEDVKGIHDMVAELNKENGWDIPLHVDAASGGFVAPFITPDLQWDFRLPLVKSINVSGHKFGLVYAGVGWLLFRESQDLHEDLVFRVNYLGGDQASFTLVSGCLIRTPHFIPLFCSTPLLLLR
jgi:glutamate decarboxylase